MDETRSKGLLNSDKYQQMKSTLGLYQDSEGVVRCQGRIGLSSLPYDTKFFTYEKLLTIIVETEGILNSRPLNYVSDEMRDPLTPSQLVIGRRLWSSHGSAKQPSAGYHTVRDLSRSEKYLNTVLSHF